MSGISREQLYGYAQNRDLELRLVGQGDNQTIETRDGWWGGRVMRNLKIPFEDRTDKQDAYLGAKQKVFDALVENFGLTIAEKAFRANIGEISEATGRWYTDPDYPITGRHIEKMLETAERELARNDGIGNWIAEMRGVPEEYRVARDIQLGKPIYDPTPEPISARDACQRLEDNLGDDVEKFLDDRHGPQHGFWIIDLGLNRQVHGDYRARLGVHVDRNDPNMLHLRDHRGNEYEMKRDQLHGWLDFNLKRNFPGDEDSRFGVRSMGIYRAQEDLGALSRVVHREIGWTDPDDAFNQVQGRPPLDQLAQHNVQPARKWIDHALESIKESEDLLRTTPWDELNQLTEEKLDRLLPKDRDAKQLELHVLLGDVRTQLAELRRVVANPEVMTQHLRSEEDYKLETEFGKLIARDANALGIRDQETLRAVHARVTRALGSALYELSLQGLSLRDEAGQVHARQAVLAALDKVLTERGWTADTKMNALGVLNTALDNWLPGLQQSTLGPMDQIRDAIRPLHTTLSREVEAQIAKLEARERQLERLTGQDWYRDANDDTDDEISGSGQIHTDDDELFVSGSDDQVNYDTDDEKIPGSDNESISESDDDVETGGGRLEFLQLDERPKRRVEFFEQPRLERISLPKLRERDGGLGADVGGLYSRQEWRDFTGDWQSRIRQDKSGVPGDQEQQISPRFAGRLEAGNLSLRVQDGETRRLGYPDDLGLSLQTLKLPEGADFALALADIAGLSRFLDDVAFQDLYRKAVDGIARGVVVDGEVPVEIGVRTARDEQGKVVLDLTFRARLPQGTKYEGAGDGDPLDLALTMRVPLDQLGVQRPNVQVRQPRVEGPKPEGVDLPVQQLINDDDDDFIRFEPPLSIIRDQPRERTVSVETVDNAVELNEPPPSFSRIPFSQDGDRKVANIRDLIVPSKSQSFINRQNDQLAGDQIVMGAEFSWRLAEAMNRRTMTLQVGDGQRLPMENATGVSNHLRDLKYRDGGDVLYSESSFTRFLNPVLFDQVYREVTDQLGGGSNSEPNVSYTVNLDRRQNSEGSFEITMRAPLPNGLPRDGHPDLQQAEGLDLVMTFRVPYEQLREERPVIERGDPRLETRPQ